jgi:hypothetical protein
MDNNKQNNMVVGKSESGIREDIGKHFERKKEIPLKKKKKNVLLKFGLILFIIGSILVAIILFVYLIFFRNNDANKNDQNKAEESVETTENDNIDKDIYENQDEDGDGLTTIQELELGTKTNEIDSDYDSIPDGWEVIYNLDPLEYNDALEDGDEDKLTNVEEYKYKTDPGNSDTDKDGYSDGDEVSNGFNPEGKGKLK